MKNHVYKPLLVVIGIVVLILAVRMVYVPKDFGIGERGYMYGWHRRADIQDWKDFKVKYQGREYCKDCHSGNYAKIMKTPHRIIQCENCHGPALDHPADPPKLAIDKTRALCLRCHFPLPYASSGRSKIKSIDPLKHNPDVECSSCHNPHNPMEGLR
jgi:predicted CXXCH cytochrome family protein